jgi:hypothetical protein
VVKNVKDLKNFSYIWVAIFFVLGIYPLFNSNEINLIFISSSIIIYILSLINIKIFKSFYDIWMKIGEILGKISSSIILFIIFFILFTPISFILKLLSKDLLKKKIDKNSTTYWIKRDDQPQSMKNQF